MIAVIVAGVGVMIAIAIAVGIIDNVHARSWREVAAERRRNWEARQLEYHGVDDHDAESWDED
jgi:hypothetical protein